MNGICLALAEFLDYEFEKSCCISKYFAYKTLSHIWFTYGNYLQAETEIPCFKMICKEKLCFKMICKEQI